MPVDTERKVAVTGSGHIGLPTAAPIARGGIEVVGIDMSAHIVETVSSGKAPIEEVDLDEAGARRCRAWDTRGIWRDQPERDPDDGRRRVGGG